MRDPRELRPLTDSRAATLTVALALLGLPALLLIPDAGFALGASAALLARALLRRDRLLSEWRRPIVASGAVGAGVAAVYVFDTLLVAGFRA